MSEDGNTHARITSAKHGKVLAARSRTRHGGILRVLLVIAGLGVVGLAAGGYWIYSSMHSLGADLIDSVVDETLKDISLKEQERVGIKKSISRVTEAIRSKNLGVEKLESGMNTLIEGDKASPLIVHALEILVIDSSELDAEKKKEAHLLCQRVVRGLVEGKIKGQHCVEGIKKTLESPEWKAVGPSSLGESKKKVVVTSRGNSFNTVTQSSKTPMTLRQWALLEADLTKIASDAKVPEVPYTLDVVGQVDGLVDTLLK